MKTGTSVNTTQTYEEPLPDYDLELAKIDDANRINEMELRLKHREIQRDIKIIVISASLLGILQIFSSYLMDAINAIAPLFGAEQVVPGEILLFSGFFYFGGVILFYLNFGLVRRIFMITNLIHLGILAIMFNKLQIITFNLEGDPEDLPMVVQDFLSNIGTFELALLGFGILYVVQTVFMFKFELLSVSYDRYGR